MEYDERISKSTIEFIYPFSVCVFEDLQLGVIYLQNQDGARVVYVKKKEINVFE